MKSGIKKPTWKRMGLGLMQHVVAMFISAMVAGILFHSFLAVRSMNETKTYALDPLSAPQEFEDSSLFGEIFHTAVSDITKLVVIKGQVETDGKFDVHKHIDVTRFMDRNGAGNGCPITAVYELDDLIKWGKYGLEYTNRAMSMSDFVNYFGAVIVPENFALSEDGQLLFTGFQTLEAEEKMENLSVKEDFKAVSDRMADYSNGQLEDMVFSYIIARTSGEITMSREDDGTLTVYIRMLSNRYEPIENTAPLFEYAKNWVEYIQLQQNVVETINTLTENYVQYQNCNVLYEEGKSNIKYVVKMMTNDGLQTFSNISEVQDFSESDLTDYFSEFRRYLIYYPDSLQFIGNTNLTESDIYAYMSEYQYAYPETTHLWIGVDTGYPISGDAFSYANDNYQKIVPYINLIIGLVATFCMVWVGLGIYLTVTAGNAFDVNGERVQYTNGIDHVFTEIVLLFAVGYGYVAYLGYQYLSVVADSIFESYLQLEEVGVDILYGYGCFGTYGLLVSMFFTLFWYSLVRRVKVGNLWRESFVFWLISHIVKTVRFIFEHRNSVISVLVPYNLFLLANLIALFVTTKIADRLSLAFIVIVCTVIFDGIVGFFLFKHNAERIDIVDGIMKIREGEVEYKLDTENLHGANKEMADAVNNIGEGIRNAVRTSMKDEQMKTDLITNVSHDIKTPLTSIINYVDLLKRLDIEQEPAKTYIGVLDGKAQRLKQLTDDLVEASKISSGNIELNMERINLTELLNQTIGEFSEKLEVSCLQVIFQENNIPAYICADSRRMWRVVENLFNNICKYAMEGTRVYVDLTTTEDMVEVSIKNISRRQMNIKSDELTERFIRGDSSRSTEGSGLGLSIAKSLTQVQGGSFELQLDGDLFKVVFSFPKFLEEKEPSIAVGEKESNESDADTY